ncbi:MAG: DUF309 domain-containing protein [Candidatus Caldarchaeum sp.]
MGNGNYVEMKRFIIIVRNDGYGPEDSRRLIEVVRSQGLKVVDVRVASNHVEIDVQSGENPILHGFEIIEVVELVEKTVIDRDAEFVKALELFNAERFWEAHEALEPLWKEAKGEEKTILHGIILTAAAYVHLQKNDRNGFHSIIKRALRALSAAPDRYRELDLRDMVDKMRKAEASEKTFQLSLVEKP